MKDFFDLGYNSHRNEERWNIIKDHFPTSRSFTVVDYGSNCGTFSLLIAYYFPLSTVISIEDDEMGLGTKTHQNKIEQYRLHNNTITRVKVNKDYFSSCSNNYDFQLLLSFIHWLDIENYEQLKETLNNICRNSTITILEMPTNEICQHNGETIMRWYREANVGTGLELAKSCLPDYDVQKISCSTSRMILKIIRS